MDNLTVSDEVDDEDLSFVSLWAIEKRLAMQHNRWWLKQPRSHSHWNQAGRWTRRALRKCQISIWKRIGPFYRRHETMLLTLCLVGCFLGLAYVAWRSVAGAKQPAVDVIVAAFAWCPAILSAVTLSWWIACGRFVSLPCQQESNGFNKRPIGLNQLWLAAALILITLFNVCYVGLISADATHFAIALTASLLATWITLQFVKAVTIWCVRAAPERRISIGRPFFDRPSFIRLAITAVVLVSMLIACSPPSIGWSGIALSPLTWMWTAITRLAQDQITIWQSLLFLVLLGGVALARRAISTPLSWQVRKQILSRYRGVEIPRKSSIADEGGEYKRLSEGTPRTTLETYFQQQMNEATLPSWRRGVVETILPSDIRRDVSSWMVVLTIGLLYGVIMFHCWGLIGQSNAASTLHVIKGVSIIFGSTIVGAMEMLALYGWLRTYSFTVSQQPLSTFDIWKQVQQKGLERLDPSISHLRARDGGFDLCNGRLR